VNSTGAGSERSSGRQRCTSRTLVWMPACPSCGWGPEGWDGHQQGGAGSRAGGPRRRRRASQQGNTRPYARSPCLPALNGTGPVAPGAGSVPGLSSTISTPGHSSLTCGHAGRAGGGGGGVLRGAGGSAGRPDPRHAAHPRRGCARGAPPASTRPASSQARGGGRPCPAQGGGRRGGRGVGARCSHGRAQRSGGAGARGREIADARGGSAR
jgi:hypothetical protein